MRLFFVLLLILFMNGCGAPGSPPHATEAGNRAREQAKQRGWELQKKIKLADSVTLDVCFIASGEFEMSSPPDEPGRDSNDLPRQKRSVDCFYIGICPVTQMQYSTVMDENPSTFLDKQCPIHIVTYSQAEAFCKKVSEMTHQTVRLPTEIEFEYAARAGESTPYSTGSDVNALAEEGWFAGNSESRPHPVGTKKPNAWGVFDTHGNVWQWCSDTPSIGLASDTSSPVHALRGGSWMDAPQYCRSASRTVALANFKNVNVGFRVVLIPDSNKP
jgi:formylglycine-generating enzyme required for sulfatase activity